MKNTDFYKIQSTSDNCWRVSTVVVAALLVAKGVPTPGWASDDSAASAARVQFEEGTALLGEGDYEGALRAFRLSYENHPKPLVLYNIAMCLKVLGRHVEAVPEFEKYLTDAGPNPIPDARPQAEEALFQLRKSVGSLRVKGAPQGAWLEIDGQRRVATPLEQPVLLESGRHVLTLSIAGFEPFRQEVDIQPETEQTLSVELVPIQAYLQLDCGTENAEVSINQVVVGTCPFSGEVPAGETEIVATAPAMEPFRKTVILEPGSRVAVQAVWKKNTPLASSRTPSPIALTPVETGMNSPLFISALVSTGLGVGLGVMGLAFHVNGIKAVNRIEELKEYTSQEEYNKNFAEFQRIRHDEIPRANVGLTLGYILGGAAIASGVTMYLVDRNKTSKKKRTPALSMQPSGISLHF